MAVQLTSQIDPRTNVRAGEVEIGVTLVSHTGVVGDDLARAVVEGERDGAPSGTRSKLDDQLATPREGEQLGQLGRTGSRGQAEAVSDPMRVTIRTPKETGDRPRKHPK